MVAFDLADPHLWVPDLLVGWIFVGCGLAARAVVQGTAPAR